MAKRKTAPEVRFAFCESVFAVPNGTWHIRAVGEEGLKLGGGASAPLCGFGGHWQNGWDLNVEITEHHLAHACPKCVAAYRERKGG